MQRGVDPIELELMRNLFEAAAEEMGLTLARVTFSANIKERRDFSCALFDATGELLAQAAHIPVHLGSMPASVQAVLNRLGPLVEGDVAIVNDPFAGGTHLPDITIVTPIILKQQPSPVFYAANRAHHSDVGGTSPGSMTLSRHIDEEGIRIEPSLLYRAGTRNEELLNRLLNAVRTPEERVGDLEAQLAANHVGATAVARMVTRHGLESVQHYGRALLDYSQSFMSRTIAAIPNGEYSFEDVMDDDGAGTTNIPIRATIKITQDRATVDLTQSADQVPGCVNCPAAVTRSAVYYCFACLMTAMESTSTPPFNSGCFRNIEVITRPGSVLDAQYPAAVVAGNTETSQRIVDVTLGALAKALPHLIPASSCGTMNSIALGGKNWTYYETIGGGCGAGPTWQGESAIQCHMTNTLNTPAEAIELQYPLRILQFQRAPSTGGAGQFPGGDGIIREIQALEDCNGTLLADRRTTRPYGLSAGLAASAASDFQNDKPIPSKSHFHLNPGQSLTIITPGGGGWGAPQVPARRTTL
jgi:N-methylhydantoinase B